MKATGTMVRESEQRGGVALTGSGVLLIIALLAGGGWWGWQKAQIWWANHKASSCQAKLQAQTLDLKQTRDALTTANSAVDVAARQCNAKVQALQAHCSVRVKTAEQRARKALEAARHKPFPSGSGPAAMNQYYQEAYPP